MADLAQYSFDTSLRDGTPVHLRAIKPNDKQKLLAEYRRLSEKSMYSRFLGVKRKITEEELKYLTEIDFVRHVAIVATVQSEGNERILGVGRFVEVQKNTAERVAEVAFAVDDKHQDLGVGTVLFEQIVIIAQAAGFNKLEADVLQGNRDMLGIFQHSGFELQTTTKSGVEHVEFYITEPIPNRFY